MASRSQFEVEHVAKVPRGWHVRTVKRGDAEVRIAFPPGPRRTGSGEVVEILRSRGKNPSSVYAMAVSLGYPYLRGEGRVARDGVTWLSRVTKDSEGRGPALYIGYNQTTRKWVVEHEEAQNGRLELQREARDRAAKIRKARITRRPRFRDVSLGNPHEKTGGLHIEYSAPNQAYFLMWHGTVLRIFPTKAEAKAEMEYLLRHREDVRTRGENPSRPTVFYDSSVEKYLATVYHPQYGNLFATGSSEKAARKALAERVKHAEKTGTHRNPDNEELAEAERLYKTFHGREPSEVLELQESDEARGELTALGDLVELTIVAPNGDHVVVSFANDGVRLASAPGGRQLYLVGGNQDISAQLNLFGADESKDVIDLGEAKQVVYDAAKWQTGFQSQDWKHDFGEESGIRPRVFFKQAVSANGKPRIFFAGGVYKVERPGIID
jgi:hypothetical protein